MSIVNAHFSVNQIMSPPIFCTWKLVKHLDCFGENRRRKDIHHPPAHNFANAQQCPTIQTELRHRLSAMLPSVASKRGHETNKKCFKRVPDMRCFAAKHLKFDSN